LTTNSNSNTSPSNSRYTTIQRTRSRGVKKEEEEENSKSEDNYAKEEDDESTRETKSFKSSNLFSRKKQYSPLSRQSYVTFNRNNNNDRDLKQGPSTETSIVVRFSNDETLLTSSEANLTTDRPFKNVTINIPYTKVTGTTINSREDPFLPNNNRLRYEK